jgi:HlyD family secretion protein
VPEARTATVSGMRTRQRSRLERRRFALLSVTGAATLLSIGGLIGATFVKSPAQLAADTAPPAPTVVTAQVTDQSLTATVAMRGVVYPGTQYDVAATSLGSSGGQLYITKLPIRSGDQITNGVLLAEIDGEPMFVLKGSIPAWRTLSPGEHGPDVAELQNALALLGDYNGGDTVGYFGQATKDAVSEFYTHLGYTAPTTGGGTQQAVDQARKAVTADEAEIENLTKHKQSTAAAHRQLQTDEQALSQAEAADGPEIPASDVVFLPQVPETVVAVSGGVGQQPGSPFVELSAGDGLALTGELPPGDASELKPGETVTIYDEVSGVHATGKVASIGAPTSNVPTGTTVNIGGSSGSSGSSGGSSDGSSSGSSGASTTFVPVNITPDSPLPEALSGENVLVTVETGRTSSRVLTVPVAAIVTTASGQSQVTVVKPSGKQVSVPVTPGLSAGGYVQVTPVSGHALHAGDSVVVSG